MYLYLPPQYFQARYARARFPAIELITGVPGQPQDWINVVGITQSYLTLLRDSAVRPAERHPALPGPLAARFG